jgi:subtilisin family serine protease
VDPALWELLRAEAGTDGERVLEAVIRLARPGIEIPGVRMMARFGTIATCRIRARDVIAVRARPEVISVKAARGLSPGFAPAVDPPDSPGQAAPSLRPGDIRRDPGLGLTGQGVAVAAIDWGIDFDSAAFRWPADPGTANGNKPGGTRLLAFWDQRDQAVGPRAQPYGYGAVHYREDVDRALEDRRPYERLGYYPAIADPRDLGAHGTRTLDIAAGNGEANGPTGIAPDADLIFVHLADRNTGGLANFGDSVRLLEAIDFINRTAGLRPCVINISAGRLCGPRDGTTLVERAFDELLATMPGRFIVDSAGNYFGWRAHSCGTLAAGETLSLTVAVDPADISLNELEIWYDGADEFAVSISPPGYAAGRPVRLGERSDILVADRIAGRVYHRKHDPNNGDNHIVAYLDPIGCAGNWTITLEARQVSNGRFHAWIERDDTCRGCQARFAPDNSNSSSTIGSIATSHLPLVVGAYDGHDPDRPVARFSSAGPCRDGRSKPDLVAPGVDVLAARSAPVGASHNRGLLVRGSGTSFAAPHVTGAVALCFEAAGRQLSAEQIRSLVLGSCDPFPGTAPESRLGYGYLNIPRLIADVQQAQAAPATAPGAEESTMATEDTIVLLAAAPATAYREYLYRPGGQVASWISDRFVVVARPGERIGQTLQEGDVLLEVTPGRMSHGRCTTLSARDLELVTTRPRLAPGQLLLRPRRRVEMSEPLSVEPSAGTALDEIGEAEDADAPPWSGSPDQLAFRDQVLEAHLARSRTRAGAPQRDLASDELERVPGTTISTARATARAAGRLLAAANASLSTAQQSGDPDALHTLRLTANSGYRSNQEQRTLWLDYFSDEDGYYNSTRAARGKLADGPHSKQAIAYLLTPLHDGGFGLGGRIAAPGYSNHQGGIALDFHHERVRGYPVRNKSNSEARARWRATWFHHWLRQNAAGYGFHSIDTEEWHWEYRPGATSGSRPPTASGAVSAVGGERLAGHPGESEHLGGELWTFTATTLPLPVAVFCPRAALSYGEVEILLYVHGLLNPCSKRRPHAPAEFVTDPPFAFGHIVHASGRPIVLAVPLLDWNNPGGGHVFGQGHEHWHALAAPQNLNGLIHEVLVQLGQRQAIAAPSARDLIIAGHSRAYDFLEPLAYSRRDQAMHEGALANLSQVWAFDTAYAGRIDRWIDWLKLNPQLRVQLFYRPGSEADPSGTARVGYEFYRQRGARLAVTPVREDHCYVPAMRLPALLNPHVHIPGEEAERKAEAIGEVHALVEAEDTLPPRDRFAVVSGAIHALGARTGTSVPAVLAGLKSLAPVEMCRLGEDPDLVSALADHLAGAELAEAGAQLARGRVNTMGRADLGRIIAAPPAHTLGTLAAAYGHDGLLAHQEAYDRTGTGTIHGNRCGVPKPAGAVSTDCTEYVLAVLDQAFAAKGLTAEWQAVRRTAASNSGSRGLKGTEVIRALQADRNWQALFWSPDPTDPADGTSEHPFAYRVVRTKHTYYRIPVDPTRSVVNYRRTSPRHPVDLTGIERLRRLQFGLLAARGGIHMAMIVNGDVHEVHWDIPATSRDSITATPLERFGWQSGVIAAPPGEMDLAWRMP